MLGGAAIYANTAVFNQLTRRPNNRYFTRNSENYFAAHQNARGVCLKRNKKPGRASRILSNHSIPMIGVGQKTCRPLGKKRRAWPAKKRTPDLNAKKFQLKLQRADFTGAKNTEGGPISVGIGRLVGGAFNVYTILAGDWRRHGLGHFE